MLRFSSILLALGFSLSAGCATAPPRLDDSTTGRMDPQAVAAPDGTSVAPRSVDEVLRPAFPRGGFWCSSFPQWKSPERLDQGLVLILPGIEGTSYFNIRVARGLDEAVVPAALEVYDWTTGRYWAFLHHPFDHKRSRKAASELAEYIVRYQDAFPGRPVHLIAHSGGGAMAVFAAEALPLGRSVESIVLLGGAISPNYDLTTALTHVNSGLWNFTSSLDRFFLGLGTGLFGTLDRKHVVAAGAVGFQWPAKLSDEGIGLYLTKLHERPYEPRFALHGNLADHAGYTSASFVRAEIAPLIRD